MMELYAPCRFCGSRPEGCLVCIPQQIAFNLERAEAEERAIRALIANPRFREVLDMVLREEMATGARCGSQSGRDGSGPGACEIFAFLELEPITTP